MNFDIFGINVTDKVANQNTLYLKSLVFLHYLAKRGNAKITFSLNSLNWIVLHTQCTCVLSS